MRAQNDEKLLDSDRPLLPSLRGILATLRPTERIIAESVLDDPERIITSTVNDFAERAGASVGSIIGFCRRLGVGGFADFKIALARDLAQSGLPMSSGPDDGSLFEQVFKFHARSLDETLKINDQGRFEQVAKLLRGARRIEFFSIGLSYPVAYTAHCKLLLLGFNTSAQADSHIQLINATQLAEGDVAFAISCSGTTRETTQCLEVSRARGATTVCLTNAMKSPITKHSDICLYAAPSEISYFQAPLVSRITQLAIIDALFVFIAQENKGETAEFLQRSGNELIARQGKKAAAGPININVGLVKAKHRSLGHRRLAAAD